MAAANSTAITRWWPGPWCWQCRRPARPRYHPRSATAAGWPRATRHAGARCGAGGIGGSTATATATATRISAKTFIGRSRRRAYQRPATLCYIAGHIGDFPRVCVYYLRAAAAVQAVAGFSFVFQSLSVCREARSARNSNDARCVRRVSPVFAFLVVRRHYLCSIRAVVAVAAGNHPVPSSPKLIGEFSRKKIHDYK